MQGKVTIHISEGEITRIVSTRKLEVCIVDWSSVQGVAENDDTPEQWSIKDQAFDVEVKQLPEFEADRKATERAFRQDIAASSQLL